MQIYARTRKGLKRFRRAGHRFDMELRSYEVTKDELASIEAEPNVEIVDAEALDTLPSQSSDREDVESDLLKPLAKMTKPELQELALEHNIDPEQTKKELVTALAETFE